MAKSYKQRGAHPEGQASTRPETARPKDAQDLLGNAGVGGLAASGGAVDPSTLVQYMMQSAYLQTNEDLRDYADIVREHEGDKTGSLKRRPP